MNIASIVQRLPEELQFIMLELVEAVEQDMRAKLAVRREDFEALQAIVRELAEAQKDTERNVKELTQAQKRTEARVNDLIEAQKRTEARVNELAEAQKHTEARLERLETIVAELIEAQKRAEARLERLEIIVAELIEAQKRTEARVNELVEAQKLTEVRIQKLTDRVAKNSGQLMEMNYRDKAYAYFGALMRNVRVISLQDLEPVLEKHLSEAEMRELLPLDLLVQGRPRRIRPQEDVWLAVEVSIVVDINDVRRARQRARLLRKAGLIAAPAVAGEQATSGAELAAQEDGVLLLQDGSNHYWEEALLAIDAA
ncbi:MAG: hypothetical protein HUU23_12750 [Caldilineales bacterium]|nr:hypothetical protein [Caldilineales bacterium]